MHQPVIFQRIESFAILTCIVLFYGLIGGNWILFFALLFSIDVFMLGYLAGNKIGALAYNIGHSYILPPILLVTGYATDSTLIVSLGLIWAAHIAMDRLLGYGLKKDNGFEHTHLGIIGKNK